MKMHTHVTLTDEAVNDAVVNVSPVVPAQQHLPLVVQEVNGTTGHAPALQYATISRKCCCQCFDKLAGRNARSNVTIV